MTRDDLPGLEWDGEYSHFRRMYRNAYQREKEGLSVNWVVELPGTGLIGQAFVQLICGREELADGVARAYVYSFRVRLPYRGIGLGSVMLDVIEADLRKRNFKYVMLNVAKENTRAQKLYEKHGFSIVAHEPGCWSYQDQNGNLRNVEEPAWRMEKRLAI